MTLDDFINFIQRDPREASPETIAKLLRWTSQMTKFAKAVDARADELAKANELPGWTLGKGRAKPLAWLDGAETNAPDTWFEKKLPTPTQLVKSGKSTEAELIKNGLAIRPEPDLVPVEINCEAF